MFFYPVVNRSEYLAQCVAADECLALWMEVDKALCAHELALAVDVDFVVGEPFALFPGPGFNLFSPFL